MASLRQIRRRMKSIESIHEITKAMEMIAAFRFKRAEGRFSRLKIYTGEMEGLVSNLSKDAGESADPLFEKRQVRRKTLVVMTGDKGLCGAYNANLLKAAAAWLKTAGGAETALVAVGKVGADFFKKKRLNVALAIPEKSSADLTLAGRITAELRQLFLSGGSDSVELLYTTARAGGPGRNVIVPFLGLNYLLEKNKASAPPPPRNADGPVPLPTQYGSVLLKQAEKRAGEDYIYEPGFESVFMSLVGKYLEGKLYLCLLESLTSETAARMVAMKQATENGEEVLDHLRLLRNKTRQATITRELSEIVNGASVLV
ncbi:MAG: ATP synthase F1 subunit gamma [Candidatus Omnitrophica bacterium]|nr:ATP synthase F1 subunit gamma [Candidatus Omnitrophota bacterium]